MAKGRLVDCPTRWSLYHDASFIFSDLLGTPNQNLKSQILFFCITCFDHPALITCSIRLERFWTDFHPHPSPESESQIKTSNTRKRIYKGPLDDQSPPQYLEKMSPLRGNMTPPYSSLVLMKISNPPPPSPPPPLSSTILSFFQLLLISSSHSLSCWRFHRATLQPPPWRR